MFTFDDISWYFESKDNNLGPDAYISMVELHWVATWHHQPPAALGSWIALSKSGPTADFGRLPGKHDSHYLVSGYDHFLDTPIMQGCFCRQVDSACCWLLHHVIILLPFPDYQPSANHINGSTLLARANKPWSVIDSHQALPSWKLTWTISNEVQEICFLTRTIMNQY